MLQSEFSDWRLGIWDAKESLHVVFCIFDPCDNAIGDGDGWMGLAVNSYRKGCQPCNYVVRLHIEIALGCDFHIR
jgi:hypothetical protein